MAQKMIDLARERKTEESKENTVNKENNPYAPYGCRFEWLCATEWPCHIKYDEESWEEAYLRKNAELEDVDLIYNNKYCQMIPMNLSPLKDSERPWLNEPEYSAPVTKNKRFVIPKKTVAPLKCKITSKVKENKSESRSSPYVIPKKIVAPIKLKLTRNSPMENKTESGFSRYTITKKEVSTVPFVDSILEDAKVTKPPLSMEQMKALIHPVQPKICSSSMRIVSKAIGMLRSENTTMKGLDLISSMKKQLTPYMIEKTGLIKYIKRVQSIPQFNRSAELLLVELSEIIHSRAGSVSSVASSYIDSL